MVVPFPTRGQRAPNYWNEQLQKYIDQSAEAFVEGHVAGAVAAYAEVTATVTHTSAAYPGVAVPGMVVSAVGDGRPMEVEVHMAAVAHSTPNTLVTLWLVCDSLLGPLNQLENFVANGEGKTMKRTFTVPAGVSKTWALYSYAAAAGTTTFTGATFAAHSLKVTRG